MKSTNKIGFITLFIIILLIGSMIYVTSILKDESEQNHIYTAQLHVNSFSEQITQTVHTIDASIDNIGLVIENKKNLNKRIKEILFEYPFIRSINILDETNQIIQSSRKENIGRTINIDEYYPKPLFFGHILRFGFAINGRFLFDKDETLSIVPMSKTVELNRKKYNVVVVISNDYFINKFSNNIKKDVETLEIIRIDGKTLFSTQSDFQVNEAVAETNLYTQAIENISSSGIETIDDKKLISSYVLTDVFPLCVAVKLDYDKVMKNWESKNQIAIISLSFLIIFIAAVIVRLILQYSRSKNKEIAYQKQLIKEQAKLKNAYIVYNNTNDGILITDKNENIIDVNKAFCKNTGYKKNEVYGENPNILQSSLSGDDFYKEMWKSIEEKNYWHGEIVNQKKDGELYTELLTINRILDEKGNVKNYIGVFTNITKEKDQEVELKEKERFIFQQSKMASMGEMLENIAHQWRQPLSVISMAATGTKMEKEFGTLTDEKEIERLTIINDSAQFLSQTIDDFRDFFKPDKEKEEFYINEVVSQALSIVQSKFRNRNITIEKNISEVRVKEYKGELVQVVMNILNNARDVLEERESEERVVYIEVTKNDKDAIIKIRDSGGGIPEAIIEKIFEPYFTTKHQSQGTGIGLYMSEEIIRKHMKGTIKVSNKSFVLNGKEYYGAKFTIHIPLA